MKLIQKIAADVVKKHEADCSMVNFWVDVTPVRGDSGDWVLVYLNAKIAPNKLKERYDYSCVTLSGTEEEIEKRLDEFMYRAVRSFQKRFKINCWSD